MKALQRTLAVILAVIVGISVSLNAFAATAQKTYISDIVAVTAKDEADAKAQLEEAGYLLLPGSNVNSTLKTGVFIGYKETDNADEAITDIAAMNMNGKFSYSDYKAIMEANAETVKETIDNFLPVIAEFQANYEAGKASALAAYKTLNIYKDDKSDMLIGDYLLAFDFSEESVKQMTENFMHANTQYILAIMQQTAFASDDGNNTLIDRMVKTGPDGISRQYTGMFPTVAKARQAMEAEYGDTAEVILDGWDDLYTYLCETEDELIAFDKDGNIEPADGVFEAEEKPADEYAGFDEQTKIFAEGLDLVADVAEASSDAANFSLYNLLDGTEYGSGTLLDFFKRPASEVKKEELYPFVDAMSDGQRSQLAISGLKLTLESAFSAADTDEEAVEKIVETVTDVTECFGTTSIYEGVDSSVFEEGVAFTSAATEHERQTGESWFTKLTGIEADKAFWLKASIISTVVTSSLIVTCIASALTQWAQVKAAKAPIAAANKTVIFYQKRMDMLNIYYDEVKYPGGYNMEIFTPWEFDRENPQALENIDNAMREARTNAAEAEMQLRDARRNINVNAGNVAGIVKCVSFVLMVVALAVNIYTVYKFITTPAATEEQIPHHIMTAAMTEYGEDYVYYQTVKNLKGEPQDTNNHEADAKLGWLMLYTTKDKAAGDPILAENLAVKTGSADFGENISAVSLFNETAALNLTDEKYTGRADKANGTYITFTREASTLVGSAVTGGTAALVCIGGAAVGAVLGAVITRFAGKKKKTAAEG